MRELLGELASTAPARYSVYLLYWYKSVRELLGELLSTASARYSVYLLYWYKSTHTDTTPEKLRQTLATSLSRSTLILLALLVPKYKY